MIQDITSLYADLVKAAFFPSAPAVPTVPVKEKQVLWCSPMDGMGAWLPSCVRYVRYVNFFLCTPDWMNRNQFKLNDDKTEFLLIATKQLENVNFNSITIGNTLIEAKPEVRNLGS